MGSKREVEENIKMNLKEELNNLGEELKGMGINEEQLAKFIYAMEMEGKGVVKAFEDTIKMLDDAPIEEITEVESESLRIRDLADSKLTWIGWTLMYKDFDNHKEVVPLLVEQLRKIADELERI